MWVVEEELPALLLRLTGLSRAMPWLWVEFME